MDNIRSRFHQGSSKEKVRLKAVQKIFTHLRVGYERGIYQSWFTPFGIA